LEAAEVAVKQVFKQVEVVQVVQSMWVHRLQSQQVLIRLWSVGEVLLQ
jgi:uncharacterized protein YigA (DUF484 family)